MGYWRPPLHSAVFRLSGRRIYREVPDVRRRQVLKEVRALRGRHAKVLEPCLDNRARAGNLVPRHRDAGERLGRTPPADADEDVWQSAPHEIRVEPGDV